MTDYLMVGNKMLLVGFTPLLEIPTVPPMPPDVIVKDDDLLPIVDDADGEPIVRG